MFATRVYRNEINNAIIVIELRIIILIKLLSLFTRYKHVSSDGNKRIGEKKKKNYQFL